MQRHGAIGRDRLWRSRRVRFESPRDRGDCCYGGGPRQSVGRILGRSGISQDILIAPPVWLTGLPPPLPMVSMQPMRRPDNTVRITRVQLSNFKGFSNFSLSLEPMTMLVGPNNAGKSTIIEAFRALSIALRTARSRKPDLLRLTDGDYRGYRITTEAIPMSLENAQHNYSDEDAVVIFSLSNGGVLRLVFSTDMACSLIVDSNGAAIRSVAEFKRRFPIDIGVVPILGPLEHDEQVVDRKTVQRNLQTHRASRNFRNYWYDSSSEEFEEFRQAVRETWDQIDIQRPELSIGMDGPSVLHMMCTENRMTRELYWMGFGFHIWLQIMTHALRARDATILVLDEPETYMHPEMQRYLLNFLRESGTDCLLATHSSELVTEAERSEVVLVDKNQRSGKRLRATSHVDALDALGSRFNFALTDVLRQRVALLLEGDSDLRHLKQLGARLSPRVLTGASVPPVIALGGHQPERASELARAMKTLIGPDVRLAVVLDRDYRPDEEVIQIEADLRGEFNVVRVLRRKEIENYFLSPSAISKAIDSQRKEGATGNEIDVTALLTSVTDEMRADAEGHCVAQYITYGSEAKRGTDPSTLSREALERFRDGWESLDGRLATVSGKECLRRINHALQEQGLKALTTSRLANYTSGSEMPFEMTELLRGLDQLKPQ